MQNIVFEKLIAKNFRCHEYIEIDFSENKLIAIVGKNGSGKSSIMMAFRTALYGNPGEQLTIADMVNKKIGKNMEIIIPFKIDNDSYRVERYYKRI